MNREVEQIGEKATQKTIKKINNLITVLAKKGESFFNLGNDADWDNHAGLIRVRNSNNYNFFIASKLTPEGEYYNPDEHLAILHLYKQENFGSRHTKYIIDKKEDGLEIDRFDEFSNDLLDREKIAAIRKYAQLSEQEREEKTEKFKLKIKQRQEDEKSLGLSFVNENEALNLFSLLERIVKS